MRLTTDLTLGEEWVIPPIMLYSGSLIYTTPSDVQTSIGLPHLPIKTGFPAFFPQPYTGAVSLVWIYLATNIFQILMNKNTGLFVIYLCKMTKNVKKWVKLCKLVCPVTTMHHLSNQLYWSNLTLSHYVLHVCTTCHPLSRPSHIL